MATLRAMPAAVRNEREGKYERRPGVPRRSAMIRMIQLTNDVSGIGAWAPRAEVPLLRTHLLCVCVCVGVQGVCFASFVIAHVHSLWNIFKKE